MEKQALQHLYRSLDYLAESQAQIQQAIFEAGKRAEKDCKEREERLLKAAKLLKNSSTLQCKAAQYFIKSMKSFLETRPMFHWNDERIKGHICLCFIAYTLLQALIRKLAQAAIPQSENAIRATLDSMLCPC